MLDVHRLGQVEGERDTIRARLNAPRRRPWWKLGRYSHSSLGDVGATYGARTGTDTVGRIGGTPSLALQFG